MRNEELKVTYIDPKMRALYVAPLPDGGFGLWCQQDKEAPRRLLAKNYIKSDGYGTYDEAQKALDLYVANKRSEGSSWARWDVSVNGKTVGWDDYHSMVRGELPAPTAAVPAAIVSLANIEYRIATHMQGAYENMLEVGRCLIEAKDAGLVPHGQWEAWVKHHTGMHERNAQKLMQAARCVHAGSMMNKLPISKIQAILSLPEPEREPMAERATNEDMTLRKLREAIKHEKQRADQLASMQVKTIAKADQSAREAFAAKAEANQLRQQLEQAIQAKTTGISDEAKAEITRLKDELAEAESYAEQQAELRQKAQLELLNRHVQAARGQAEAECDGLSVSELAAAVRAFIGSAGVLPHIGPSLAQISESERTQMIQYVTMVEAWTEGARRALDTMIIHDIDQEVCQ